MPGVDELAVIVDADDQRAKVFPAAARLSKAADDDLLLTDGLDLEPGATSHARLVGAVTKFGDDAFQSFLLGCFEKGLAVAENMLRVLEQARIVDDVAQQALAVLERNAEEPLAVQVDDVEHDVLHGMRFFAPVLQQLK